tara:strand:- start:23 stop:289 length:267 start_codon:yes stop_codon:yes gene_type:complete
MRKNQRLKKLVIETLLALGGKKAGKDSVSFLKKGLIVKDENGFKYTVTDVDFINSDPVVSAYRYDTNGKTIEKIEIKGKKEFKKYEPV